MNNKTILTGLLGLMLLATPAVAEARALPAEPANMTLDVVLTRAIRNNPNIQAAEARLRQARIEKENQDLWWARTIRANANYAPFGGNFGGMGGTVTADGLVLPTAVIGIGANLGEMLAGPKNSARAAEAVIIAEAELRRTTLEVAANVTAAYQEYQAAKEMASLTDDMVQAAEADLKIAERQFARGGSAANGVMGARLAAQRVRADRIQLTGNVAKSWTNLLSLMGTDEWVPGKEKGN
ncbi:MAG: TolC family protein [Candidatus Sericytochromatia bacterium]